MKRTMLFRGWWQSPSRWVAAGLPLIAVGCAADAVDGGENARTSPQPIAIDAVDADEPWRNSSVFLQSTGGNCTGTLIGPSVVLTANHCMTGGTTFPIHWARGTVALNGPWKGTVGVRKPADADYSHSVSSAGDADVFQYFEVEAPSESPQDFAVLHLDRRIPVGSGPGTWNVTPVHPWEDDQSCPSTFGEGDLAMFSGYGLSSSPTSVTTFRRTRGA